MEFHRYLLFAALAAVLWVTVFLGAGYLFGNIQWVQDYLAVALAIAVAASAIPGFIIWAVHYCGAGARRRPDAPARRRRPRPVGLVVLRGHGPPPMRYAAEVESVRHQARAAAGPGARATVTNR